VPLAQLLAQQLDLPVIVDNDVNALTVAEQWFGAGRSVQDFLVISIGRGIGMGMVLDGQLYRGAGGGAGEFGHTIVVPDGPRCACGKHGCLEALISDAALTQRAATALGRAVTIGEAVDLALRGDASLQAIFASAGRTLGMAVANLVNVLNPALIIIGGEGTRAGSLVSDPFQAALRANCFDGLADDLRVVTEPWGDDAWARGAASLLLSELFRPALHRSEEARPSLIIRNR
jgi:N-acetylglucosamine repressor